MYPFKTGIMTDNLKTDFWQAARLASEMGADGIQFMAAGPLAPEQLDGEKIKALQALLQERHLEISALCGSVGSGGFTHPAENPGRIRRAKRLAALAAKLHTRVITLHIGALPEDPRSESYQAVFEACAAAGTYAEQLGVQFAVETGPETALVLKDFLDALPCKGFAVNLDPANFVMVSHDDPVQAVYTLKDYIVHTHAKDGIWLKELEEKAKRENRPDQWKQSDFYRETALGEGSVPFRAYLNALNEIGYRGYLTLERENTADPARQVRESFAALQQFVKE